ncbi:hypothetical protein [Clostridium tyrobutyricum]|uniref:hypothetical protein n=1 Tax=Clostridium tyrobutyricum TaxID=1519 RepID=UPI001C380553|nr:hypothetical protein [Clostridium tyrobutyricum]MBV4417169.1 hypothetical protein [Clostridium tyrobutyricum]
MENEKKVVHEGQVQDQLRKTVLPSLEIKNSKIFLDGTEIRGVTSYSLVTVAPRNPKLTLEIEVHSKINADKYEKEVALEGQVQKQQSVKIEITNSSEFQELISQTIDNLNRIKSFKFKIKVIK